MTITSGKRSSVQNPQRYISANAGNPGLMAAPTATDGGTGSTVSCAFTTVTGNTSYQVLSNPGSLTATGAASPIVVSGLTAGTAYTFQIAGINANSTGAYSAASNSVTPVTPTSFESIVTATLDYGNSITISSIPSTYKHLQLRLNGRYASASAGAVAFAVQVNGDTNSNYSFHTLDGDGSSANANGTSSFNMMQFSYIPRNGALSNTNGVSIIDIIDYASTSKNKTFRAFGGVNLNGGSGQMVQLASGLWMSTSAINSITIIAYGNQWDGNGTVALYGIKG